MCQKRSTPLMVDFVKAEHLLSIALFKFFLTFIETWGLILKRDLAKTAAMQHKVTDRRGIQYSGTVALVIALLPHSKKVPGSIPAWVAVYSGRLSHWGLSVWSLHVLPVLAWGSLHISSISTPIKNMQNAIRSCP